MPYREGNGSPLLHKLTPRHSCSGSTHPGPCCSLSNEAPCQSLLLLWCPLAFPCALLKHCLPFSYPPPFRPPAPSVCFSCAPCQPSMNSQVCKFIAACSRRHTETPVGGCASKQGAYMHQRLRSRKRRSLPAWCDRAAAGGAQRSVCSHWLIPAHSARPSWADPITFSCKLCRAASWAPRCSPGAASWRCCLLGRLRPALGELQVGAARAGEARVP